MTSHTHFFVLLFADRAPDTGIRDSVVACGSAHEATVRAAQIAGYAEYEGAVAVRARSRDGKLMGKPAVLASYGAVAQDINAHLRAHAL